MSVDIGTSVTTLPIAQLSSPLSNDPSPVAPDVSPSSGAVVPVEEKLTEHIATVKLMDDASKTSTSNDTTAAEPKNSIDRPASKDDTSEVKEEKTPAATVSTPPSASTVAIVSAPVGPVSTSTSTSAAISSTGELLNGGYKRGGAENDPETGYYDEIEIEDMEYDETTSTYTYPCPCGDKFRITKDELLDGEDLARCPSCSLLIKVVYDPDDLEEED